MVKLTKSKNQNDEIRPVNYGTEKTYRLKGTT